jgi:hypothetical protein
MEFFVLMAVSSRTGYLEADVGPKRLASLESNSRYDLVLHEIERYVWNAQFTPYTKEGDMEVCRDDRGSSRAASGT